MIQRIQTIHLTVSVLLGLLTVILGLTAAEDSVVVSAFGDELAFVRYIFIFLAAAGAIVAAWSIFLFKTRVRQINMVSWSTILYLLAVIALGASYLATGCEAPWTSAAAFMPVVAIVFNLLAQRRIRFDERLVRSADRLR